MAAKYRWEEYEEQKAAKPDSEQQSETKKYRWEEYRQANGNQRYRWDDGTWGQQIADSVYERVKTWLGNHQNYLSNYENRYGSRKYSYEDAYVSDSADWLNTISQQKSAFDAEADSILDYMNQYSGYLDEEFMKSVQETLALARGDQGKILESATKDRDYWNTFAPNEAQKAEGYTADKLYKQWQEEMKQYTADLDYDVEAGMRELEALKKEKEDYFTGKAAARTKAESEESFWDSLGRWLGNTPDTSIPLAGASTALSEEKDPVEYDFDKRISELETQINRAKYTQGYEGYMANMNAADYAANSKYTSTRTDVAMDDALWGVPGYQLYDESKLFGDHAYDYINRNADALDVASYNDTQTSAYFLGVDEGFLKTMTEDEIGVYNYLYKTQGKEAANEFLSFIASDLEGRRRTQENAQWAAYAAEDPVGSSVFSTLISPMKGLSYLGQAADMLDDGAMDENAGYNRFSEIPGAIRNQVSTTIEKSGKWGKVGSFAYNTGMSMADFLFTTGVSGGNQAISLAIMGTGAAADATIAAKERGLKDDEAFALGTIAGLAEVAMEKVSLGAWLDGDLSEGALRYVLKNALSEGAEEAGTSAVNLLADIMIAGDKSEWKMAMQAYMDAGKTEAEAFGLVAAKYAGEIGLDALGGMLSGGTIGGTTYAGTSVAAAVKYGRTGRNKETAQKIVTENLELNPQSQYGQKMQSRLDDGKALTGMQVRNLLAANKELVTEQDLQKIQKAAQERLTALGQTENVEKIAELATKWATGQKLSLSEKHTITTSTYGSRVANELLPHNIASGKFSTEWAEEIGTKLVNAKAYNKALIESIIEEMASTEDPAEPKGLTDRVGTDSNHAVSESGQATIIETGKAVSLDKAEVTELVTDGTTGKVTDMVMKVEGETVKASGIEYQDDNQALLVEGVGQIENITPGDATVLIRDYAGSGLSAGEYLNGMDEAYTYGYYGYSEEDLKAGNFTQKLSNELMMSAYELGRAAKILKGTNKAESIKKMRTAADVAVSKKEMTTQQKARFKSGDTEVYFMDGGTVTKFDEAGHQYDETRMAGVNTAKFLSKLGIGRKFYFYESYVNAAGERVYKDASGNEVKAPNGLYKSSDGSIYIDLNAGDAGQGTTLYTLAHELTHFIKQWSAGKFNALADFLIAEYGKTDMTMHERVVEMQNKLSKIRGESVSYDEAFEEVVADAMSTMFADGKLHEKLAKLRVQDKRLFNKVRQFFEKLIAKFRDLYAELTPDQKDAQDVRQMKDAFDRIQTAFAEALVEASDNFRTAMESVVEAKAEPVSADEIITDGAVVTDGEGEKHSIRSMKSDIAEGKMFEDLKTYCGWTDAQVVTLRHQLEDLVEYMTPYRDILDMNESYGREGRRFSPYKPNSDPLYKISMDFSTLCSKRLLTQYVIENLQLRENRPMGAEEQMAIRDMLNEYRKVEKGLQVACAMCYVEAARLKSPNQIQRWLDDPVPHLINYFAQKNTEFNASVKEAQADFKESRGYDRDATKKDMKPGDVKELNKIGPRLRSQYQLSAEEQAIVEKAKTLPNSTYLTAGNLANLSETDPVIYNAYTAFVRTATRSKSLETDEPYYYGDSRRDNGNGIIVSDSFIEAVNRENGMRFSSWSDWRIQHMLDYITAVIDNSVRGAAMHGYTKFGEEVRVLGKTGMMFNMSGVAGSQNGLNPDGSLSFSDTESIDVNEAIQLREEFPDTAGLQCIGVSNEHITQLLRSDIIDYVIPYHVSGLNAALRRMADIHGWKDYTSTQHAAIDKSIKLENAVDKEHWHEEPVYSEFFVGYDTGMTGIEAMRASAEKYKQLCHDRGLTPKFNQFAQEENYWKLLIDRKMVNQKTGKLIRQRAVTPTFDFGSIKQVVDRHVQNYDAGLEARALNHIVENWDTLPQRIKDLKSGNAKAKKAKNAADTLANETVAAQPKKSAEKRSDRNSNVENREGNRYSNRYEKRFFPGNVFPTGQTHTAISEWANRKEVKIGDKRLVSYKGAYYRVEKFDDMDFGYLITKKYDAQSYEEDLREYGEIDSGESVQSGFDEIIARSGETAEHGSGGYHADSSGSGYGSENNRLREVDEGEYGRREDSGQTERDRQGGLRDQRQIGRESLEWTPQELYDKMLDLDRKLVSASGKYATRLKNQRERYARMIDEMRGWDQVRYSDRDSTGKQLSKNQQVFFTDSKVRDENGNLLVMYHGTSKGGFTVFDTYKSKYGLFGAGFYFTDSENIGESYTKKGKGNNPQVYKAYLNIKNPLDMDAPADPAEWSKAFDEVDFPESGTNEDFYRALEEYYEDQQIAKWEVEDIIRESIEYGMGYDGITHIGGGRVNSDGERHRVYIAFEPEQIKNVDNQNPTTDPDIRFSERTGESVSNRHLLANAFEGITKSSDEYKMIQEYRGHIKQLNALEAKLGDLNAQIRKIRFGTQGKRDTARLAKVEEEAKKIAGEINRHDRRLLQLEASEPLRRVVERERKKEAKKTKEHVAEIQQNRKLRAEQTELRHKIRKVIRDLDKLLNRGNKKLNVKEDVQKVVTKALQAADILFTDNYGNYDMLRNGIHTELSDAEEALVKTCARMLKDLDKMPTDGYDNFQARQEAENRLKAKMAGLKEVFARERKRLNSTTVSSILGELAEAYASLEKSEQSYVQGAYNEAVYNFLKNLQSEVGGTIVQDMTKDQLESLYAAYKMVLTTVRKANQMFNEELKQTREQLGNAVIHEVITAGGTHGLWTKGEIARSQADWNNTKPVWVANRIGSDTFGKLMKGLFKGQYNFAVDIQEAKKFKLEMDRKYRPRSWDAEKQHPFRTPTGKEFSLNLQQIMSLYAYSKREQAYSHLLNGGFAFDSNSTVIVDEKGIKRTYLRDGATAYKLNEATLNEILRTLTKEQKAYVDEMQKYLSEVMGEKGNEVSMQLYGIRMFNEKFYFPLRSSGAYLERAKEAELKKQQGQINIVNSGFTHAVKPEAKNPVILAGFADVWAEHCNEMSMYHSMVLPMEDFRKVYNYSTIHDDKVDSASVYQTIQDAYGKAATGYIDQLYRELNAGATIDPRETPFKARISKFKKAAVMLSASVVVQQFSSIGRAYAIIDPKYFTGAKVNSGTQLSAVEEMKKYAPVAIIKEMGGFDTGTKGSAKAYILAEEYGKGERIQGIKTDEQYRSDLMGYLPAKADEKTWCAIWEAAKRETRAKHPKMDVQSEEFLKLAAERFSETIEKTQVYDSVLARSANMRSKSAFMQMATAFMAEPTTTINLLENAIRSKDKKQMARAFGAVAVSIVLNNALASIVYAMRDDDEDETFLEKYFQSFASGMVDDINPMSYYPFLKDVYSLFQGYDVERADMSVIADVRDAMKKAMSVIGKDTSEMDDKELAEHRKNVWGVLMSLLDAGCSAFGVPVKNVRRDAKGIINAFQTVSKDITERDTSWDSFWDKVGAAVKDTIPIFAWTKDRAKGDKLYDAIISGDKSLVSRLKAGYKDEAAYNSAVRKALREGDPRIHEAAKAKYEGNSEAYKRIFRQIQGEGKFSFDEIMDAINAELSKIKSGLEPAGESSNYSATDFVNAVIVGEASTAAAMREEILAYKVAGGDTMEEAEKSFAGSVATSVRNAFDTGLLDAAGAENMLVEYAGKDEEEAAAKVSYWAFCKENPQYDLSQANVEDYHEFAEPAEIPLEVFAEYVEGTKGLVTIRDEWGDVELSVRDQTLAVIDSLPLTWQQKDALYLAAGYAESKMWDVPW